MLGHITLEESNLTPGLGFCLLVQELAKSFNQSVDSDDECFLINELSGSSKPNHT